MAILSLGKNCPQVQSFSGPYFSAFGLNTVFSLQSKYGEIRTRNIPYLNTFNAVFGRMVIKSTIVAAEKQDCVRKQQKWSKVNNK